LSTAHQALLINLINDLHGHHGIAPCPFNNNLTASDPSTSSAILQCRGELGHCLGFRLRRDVGIDIHRAADATMGWRKVAVTMTQNSHETITWAL
jgi:hypothetical protein